MLPEHFAEQHMRVYFRKNDPKSLEKAKRLVNALLIQILHTCQVELVLRDGLITTACPQVMLFPSSIWDVTPGYVASHLKNDSFTESKGYVVELSDGQDGQVITLS